MNLPPGNSEKEPFAEQPPALPRWLKLSAMAVLVLIVVVVVLQLTGVQHGPGMHVN